MMHLDVQKSGPALSQCNRCGRIGPRAPGGPAPWWLVRLFIFARYSLRRRIVERLINLIVSKLLSRLNERWISSNYYRTLSNMLNSHAERYICAPPRPTFYG